MSWRRVGSLFAPFRGRIAIVVALIVAPRSSPSPRPSSCGSSSTTPSPSRTSGCSSSWSAACSPSPSRPPCSASARPSSPRGSARRSCTACGPTFQPPPAPVALLLHADPRWRGPVPADQRRRRMQSVVTSTATSIASNVTTAVGTAIAMVALSWRLSLLSLLVIPPAIWLTRRVALLRRTSPPSSSAGWPTCSRRSTRACRSAASSCQDPRRDRDHLGPVRRHLARAGRPRGPVPARRPLADGDDERRLRRDPRA